MLAGQRPQLKYNIIGYSPFSVYGGGNLLILLARCKMGHAGVVCSGLLQSIRGRMSYIDYPFAAGLHICPTTILLKIHPCRHSSLSSGYSGNTTKSRYAINYVVAFVGFVKV